MARLKARPGGDDDMEISEGTVFTETETPVTG